MSKQREALQLALDALTEVIGWQWVGPMRVMDEAEDAMAAIREALAEPEQELEPVAWVRKDQFGSLHFVQPLYTTPSARKPLTDEEIDDLELPPSGCNFRDIVRAIERAHGIGD